MFVERMSEWLDERDAHKMAERNDECNEFASEIWDLFGYGTRWD